MTRATMPSTTAGSISISSGCGDPEQDVAALTADYTEPFPGAAKRLEKVLRIMEKAYRSAELRREAEDLIAGLGD